MISLISKPGKINYVPKSRTQKSKDTTFGANNLNYSDERIKEDGDI